MRTTIDLPDDLHHAVNSIAAHSRKSMNQTVAELIRRGLQAPQLTDSDANASTANIASVIRMDPLTGLPLIRSARPVSVEDVRALEDG